MASSLVLLIFILFYVFIVVAKQAGSRVKPVMKSMNDEDAVDFTKIDGNDEQRLFKHMLKGYSSAVRPVFNASHQVTVFIGLTLTHIFNIDERNQVLALNVWVEQSWTDERITWRPADFGNISKLTMAMRYLWTPDIVLYNNARDFSRGFVDTNLHVSSDGLVQWAPPQKIYSRCHMDVSNFPFDHQFCSLVFRSWMYDLPQLDLRIVQRYDGNSPFTKDSFTENGEWEIVDNRTFRYIHTSGSTEYSTVVFEMHLRRRMLYFMYNIIMPCVMLSILTMMQFALPCESGEKITLGLTVLLAYSVFSFNIAESMPETSEVIPLIAIYLMAIMAISALSVVFSVFVLTLRHGAENKTDMPRWLEFLGFRLLAPLFGGSTQEKRRKHERAKCIIDTNRVLKANGIREETISKGLIERVQAELEFEHMVARWSQLANIFDRFFFTTVFMLTVSSTAFLLMVAPNMENPSLHDRVWDIL